MPLTGSASSLYVRLSSYVYFFDSNLTAVDKVQTNLLIELIVLVNFHLILSVFSFWLFILLQAKDACLIAFFHRDWVTFTSS